MTNGQSGCFVWMVLITGGVLAAMALDHGCVTVPAVQSISEPSHGTTYNPKATVEQSTGTDVRLWTEVEVTRPTGANIRVQTIEAAPTTSTPILTSLTGWECLLAPLQDLPDSSEKVGLMVCKSTSGIAISVVTCSKTKRRSSSMMYVSDNATTIKFATSCTVR